MGKTGFNLVTIDKLGELVADLGSEKITLEEANVRLDSIRNSQPIVFGHMLTGVGYALSGFGFAGFLRCSPLDLLFSALLGILVYIILCVANKLVTQPGYAVTFFCALIIGVIAAAISIALPTINIYLISLSALIYLIPGFVISCGIIEISYKYVVSGLINLVNGLVSLIIIFSGTFIGVLIINCFSPIVTNPASTHLNQYLSWPLAIIMACGLAIIFQVPKKYFIWSMVSIILVCIGILIGRVIDGINLGNLIGSIVAVLFANFWSNKYRRPTSIILIPSVVFLVSGSIGFRGFVALSSHNVHLGTHDITQMFIVAISIAIGLSIGNFIYKPKISL